jgi:hypothetical protein
MVNFQMSRHSQGTPHLNPPKIPIDFLNIDDDTEFFIDHPFDIFNLGKAVEG